jgi:NADH-quinone oxidoreductase subunit A
MAWLLVVPPVAFTIILLVVWAVFGASGTLALKRKGSRGALDKPYAGGEDFPRQGFQPDYGEFFPFAFFFTIMHVVTLIVATSPVRTLQSLSIAGIYVLGALLGLLMLFRR